MRRKMATLDPRDCLLDLVSCLTWSGQALSVAGYRLIPSGTPRGCCFLSPWLFALSFMYFAMPIRQGAWLGTEEFLVGG